MFSTAEQQMVVVMLAEGNPVWYVAAQVNRHSRDVEAVGRAFGYPDPVQLRRAAARLTRRAVRELARPAA